MQEIVIYLVLNFCYNFSKVSVCVYCEVLGKTRGGGKSPTKEMKNKLRFPPNLYSKFLYIFVQIPFRERRNGGDKGSSFCVLVPSKTGKDKTNNPILVSVCAKVQSEL